MRRPVNRLRCPGLPHSILELVVLWWPQDHLGSFGQIGRITNAVWVILPGQLTVSLADVPTLIVLPYGLRVSFNSIKHYGVLHHDIPLVINSFLPKALELLHGVLEDLRARE